MYEKNDAALFLVAMDSGLHLHSCFVPHDRAGADHAGFRIGFSCSPI